MKHSVQAASAAPPDRQLRRARVVFLASVAVTLLLYVVPFGRVIGYPLLLISTLVHELGHGIAATLVGGTFHSFQMHADGSGVALWSGKVSGPARAFIAAGGLCGPALVAGVGFFVARRPRLSRWGLAVAGLALVALEILVVRGGFGLAFAGALALILLVVALKGRPETAQLVMVFSCVQLALSVFSRGDYLFMRVAHTANGVMPSDVEHMSQALALPYWFWGGVCGLVSVAAVAAGALSFLRRRR